MVMDKYHGFSPIPAYMERQALRHDLERQLRERDEDMEAQRREITFGFDEVRYLS
jgi:hypothetical protein